MDASGLSDGTLRFVAILTAILTRPRGSLLVIEEIDNGIHPSRAKLLIDILQTEGQKAGVDVLVTSHNPAFLNELTPKYLPVVMLAYRDREKGYSHLKPVSDAVELPFLLGKGGLGKIVADEHLYPLLNK
jgi:predicted ATPase